jgi:predicted DNA-binding transcriptional regulator AlpA
MSAKSVAQKPKARKRYVRRTSSRFMQRQELADILAVHVETIKRREKTTKGWPRPVRIGSKIVMYDRADVERFLQEFAK